MCAGVRDVANLCWKLHAVVSGSLAESVLDSYQDERLPHVKEVTNRAVKVGRIIVERNRIRAAIRNRFFRTAGHVPGFMTWLRNHRWLPDARYHHGLLARNGNPAAGWLIPQPWVIDENGDRVRSMTSSVARGRCCTSDLRRQHIPGGWPACRSSRSQPQAALQALTGSSTATVC